MKLRLAAMAILGLLLGASLMAGLLPGFSYAAQDRDRIEAPPSLQSPLGTDELGRDRLARLLFATRTSLLLASAAALTATLVAAAITIAAVYCGGWREGLVGRGIDLMLSLPWLFLLLAARALLPLNASPLTSLVVTYGLLALLGWASPARVLRARIRAFRESGFVLQARAAGSAEGRILARHILPNLRPVMMAQFWTSIPVFVLAEANLGFLGLSASEPFATWGSLLRELQSPLALRAECFAPVLAVAISVSCFKLAAPWGAQEV